MAERVHLFTTPNLLHATPNSLHATPNLFHAFLNTTENGQHYLRSGQYYTTDNTGAGASANAHPSKMMDAWNSRNEFQKNETLNIQ